MVESLSHNKIPQNSYFMKRKYIQPTTNAIELQTAQMMAQSIGKSETEVDADESYSNQREYTNPIWKNMN